jgi:hypothetical protein
MRVRPLPDRMDGMRTWRRWPLFVRSSSVLVMSSAVACDRLPAGRLRPARDILLGPLHCCMRHLESQNALSPRRSQAGLVRAAHQLGRKVENGQAASMATSGGCNRCAQRTSTVSPSVQYTPCADSFLIRAVGPQHPA